MRALRGARLTERNDPSGLTSNRHKPAAYRDVDGVQRQLSHSDHAVMKTEENVAA